MTFCFNLGRLGQIDWGFQEQRKGKTFEQLRDIKICNGRPLTLVSGEVTHRRCYRMAGKGVQVLPHLILCHSTYKPQGKGTQEFL